MQVSPWSISEHVAHPQKETPHPLVTSHSPYPPLPVLGNHESTRFCLCRFASSGHFIQMESICGLLWVFCTWLLSLSRFSWFIYAVACDRTLFLFIVERYSIVWSIPWFICEHLGSVHVLAITNNAALNVSTSSCVDIYLHFFRVYT